MKEPVFKKSDLKHFAVVDEPGTYMVKSYGATLFEDGDKSRYLLNLRAATVNGLEDCLEIIGNRNECPYSEFNGTNCFMTGVLWKDSVKDTIHIPTRGENVIATYDYNEEGELWCVSITLVPRKTLRTFNPDAYNKSRELFNDIIKQK